MAKGRLPAFELLVAILLLASPPALMQPAWARDAPLAAADPVLEQRLMVLAAELRCLVCQNQSIADSDATLAVDLRDQIREKLKQGASEPEIIEFMTARYGDFVLYRPPFRAATALLWLGPLLLMLGGAGLLVHHIARRRQEGEVELTDAERERASSLLARDEAHGK